MVFFRNDYGEGCIEPIAKLLAQANEQSNPGYGEDQYSGRAAQLIQSKLPDVPSDIHFIVSGTLTNIVMIRHVLKPYEAVICCDTAHINQHEAGAIEVSGHKMITVPNVNGKLTAALIERVVESYKNSPNMYLIPRLVYISNATELGTVYTRQELEKISQICKERDLLLMMDGARIGPALMSGIDYSLNDIAKWCDLFSIGGTKNGALFGEAVVIPNNELKPYFRYVQKQSGAILAKGWLIGLQFIGLFENDDFYKCAGYANKLAAKIQNKIIELGYPLFMRSATNQVFVVLNPAQHEYIRQKVDCEVWETWDESIIIRLVTSWHTSEENVDELCQILEDAASLGKPEIPLNDVLARKAEILKEEKEKAEKTEPEGKPEEAEEDEDE